MRKFLAVIQFWLTITKVCSEKTIFTVGADLRVCPSEIIYLKNCRNWESRTNN